MSDSISQLQSHLATLEQENARLRSQLDTCQQSHQALQERVAELEKSKRTLKARDRILEATASAANALLTIENFDDALNTALQIIGESLDTDRVLVIENFDHPSNPPSIWWRVLYEWASPHAISQLFHSDLAQGSYEGVEEWYELLSRGQSISCLLEDMPEPFRSGQAELGLKALHAVPIFVEGKFWGHVGFDDCREAKRRSNAELAVLKTAAACIGSAIQQERIRKAQAQWLEATAVAANALLSNVNLDSGMNQALRIIGEGIDVDRVVVFQHVDDPSGRSLGSVCLLYEWDSSYASSQISHPELNEISAEEFGDWTARLKAGDWVGNTIDELPEPARSGQEELGVQSTYAVPVFVDGSWWGTVSIDHCREKKRLTEAEIAVFRTAAACVGSAIQRDHIQRAHQEAERAILLEREQAAQERAKLLDTVATVANLLLRSPDYTTVFSDVVRLLGEAVGSDRCGIGQNITHPVSGKPAIRILPEWCKPEILQSGEFSPHSDHLYLWEEDAPHVYTTLAQGNVINSLVADLPEPERSLLVAQGNTAELFVPILVNRQLWGYIAFDNCGEPRPYDETEIAILKVAADSIAAAIERQAIDDTLRESEHRYRTLFEISSEGIYRWEYEQPIPLSLPVNEQIDLIYRHLYVTEANAPFAAMYGYDNPENLVGIRLTDIHVEESQQNLAFVRACVENRHRIQNYESEEIDRYGQQCYFLNNVTSIIKDGYVYSGWGTQINITELRQAQETLANERIRAATERTELLKTITSVANYLLRSPDYTTVLPEVLHILGEAAGADRCSLVQNVTDPASGKPAVQMPTEWCRAGIQASIFHTPELESALLWEYFPDFQQKLVQGETAHFLISDLSEPACQILQAQGIISMTLVPIMVQRQFWGVFSFDYCGESQPDDELDTAIFAIAVDSIAAAIKRQLKDRALLETEKRYRTLFKLSNEGIYRFEITPPIPTSLSIDEQLDLLYQNYHIAEVNNTFVTQYGFNSPDDVIAKGLPDFYPEASDISLAMNRAVIESGYQIRNAETEETDLSGQYRYFLQNVVGDVRDGYFWGGWGVQTDITELKEAQEALLQAEQARVAELAKANEELRQREHEVQRSNRLLEATATAANALLTVENFDEAVNTALRIIGEGLDTDRIGVLEHFDDPSGQSLGYLKDLYEWNSPYVVRQLSHPEFRQISYEGIEEWYELHRNGQGISCLIDEMQEPFRGKQQELGVKALHGVPIMVNGKYWGVIVFDDCQEAKRRSPAEIAVLKTVADCIGSAIERQRSQQALLQAEQNRAAELVKANEALKQTLDVLATEPELDCFLGHVMTALMQQLAAASATLWLYNFKEHTATLHLLHEQGTVMTAAQSKHPSAAQPISLDSSTAWWSFKSAHRYPFVYEDVPNHPLLLPAHRQYLSSLGIQTVLSAPLVLGTQTVGSICLRFREARQFRPEELELVQALANQATLAIQLTQLAEAAKQAAIAREREKAESAILEERNRMAREIHDTLAQAFTGISIQLGVAKRIAIEQPEEACDLIEQATELAHTGLAEARRSVWTLQPDAETYQDLARELRRSLQQMTASTSIQSEIQIYGTPGFVPPDVGMNLLRVGQEAITNVLRHATATQITIQLHYDSDSIRLQVQDDGCGFDLNHQTDAGFGLLGMQQRCHRLDGQLTVISQPGGGTQIVAQMPLGEGRSILNS